ncbi:hypothetical protein QR680_006847 [Steinernema hermaphroditum]|uniref:Tyr recombinase domain-containing protein n=1 Tax=Steinernema hermaphroditum TaxID=289476 RepID=A0AA39HWU1_9BILA|nr:hypothetical protein QR680_006847 [Steinernema hermaphroditum]
MDSGNSMDARAVGDHEPGDFPNVDTGRRRRAHAPVPRRAKKCTRSPTPSRHLGDLHEGSCASRSQAPSRSVSRSRSCSGSRHRSVSTERSRSRRSSRSHSALSGRSRSRSPSGRVSSRSASPVPAKKARVATTAEEFPEAPAISAYIEVIRPNEPVDSSLLSRAMKGFFRLRPTRPKHDFIWDVSVVVNYLAEAPTSSLKDKTLKCAMLLALCSPKRVSELASLALDRRSVTPTMWSFALAKTKNRRCGPEHRAQYTRFPGDSRICPIACLEDYLSVTEALRPEGVQALLISYRAPHNAVTSATVARWLKCVLALAGIDAVFSAHSTRSASTSAALLKGATCGQIMQAANWATSSTFERHYHREPNATAAFQNAVLNNNDAS